MTNQSVQGWQSSIDTDYTDLIKQVSNYTDNLTFFTQFAFLEFIE